MKYNNKDSWTIRTVREAIFHANTRQVRALLSANLTQQVRDGLQ